MTRGEHALSLVDLYSVIDVEADVLTSSRDHVHLTASGQAKLGRLFLGEILHRERGLVSPSHIDSLARAIRGEYEGLDLLRYSSMDDSPGLTMSDYSYFVNSVVGVTGGDVDFDGKFSSSDLVTVFIAGKYQQPYDDVGWAEGDWNGDGQFATNDLVFAMQSSGYHATEVARVPEPTCFGLGIMLSVCWMRCKSQNAAKE